MTKPMLHKLDKEEVGALSDDISLGDMCLVMMVAVLKIGDVEAARLLRRRVFIDDKSELNDALNSEQAQDIMGAGEKKEAIYMLAGYVRCEDQQKEIVATVCAVRYRLKGPPPPKKGQYQSEVLA